MYSSLKKGNRINRTIAELVRISICGGTVKTNVETLHLGWRTLESSKTVFATDCSINLTPDKDTFSDVPVKSFPSPCSVYGRPPVKVPDSRYGPRRTLLPGR